MKVCEGANAQTENSASGVKSTELIRTSQSWDGVELPDYFQGRPELVAVKYEFPAGQKLGWHHHPVMNYGVLVQGELTIIGQDGKEKTVHEGEAVVEMVNTIHHGENRGTKPVILYMLKNEENAGYTHRAAHLRTCLSTKWCARTAEEAGHKA